MFVDPTDLTPGVLDGYAQNAFSYGACAALALALHDATGWPLVKITDADSVEEDWSIGNSGLHWCVQRPADGALIDIDGVHDPDELVGCYDGEADDGKAGKIILDRRYAIEEYVEDRGEPIPLPLAASFVEPLLRKVAEQTLGAVSISEAGRRTVDELGRADVGEVGQHAVDDLL